MLTDVTIELKHYFHTNDQSDCDPGILWEAHKMVIRGILIKHGAQIKNERKKQLTMLLNKIHTVESQHKHTLTSALKCVPSPTDRRFTTL